MGLMVMAPSSFYTLKSLKILGPAAVQEEGEAQQRHRGGSAHIKKGTPTCSVDVVLRGVIAFVPCQSTSPTPPPT